MRRFLVGCFLSIQVLLPLSWYLSPSSDERFSWRMFSPQQLGEWTFSLKVNGQHTLVTNLGNTPFSTGILPRGEPDVVHAFMEWQCESRPQGTHLEFQSTCLSRCSLTSTDAFFDYRCGSSK